MDLFVREAETWVNLGLFPHIVCCYYIRVFGGIPRIFMEFVDGGSLLEAIEQGSLYDGSQPEVLQRILDIAIQFAWGLHFAHKKGLVHQDVKPANVMLTKDGIAKVTDFGMAQAKEVIETGGGNMDLMDAPRDGRSILVGMTGMTPAYCSPEQAERQQLSRRTDIWSWAVSILETFMGKKTWEDGTFVPVLMENYLENGPDDPGKPAIPPSLANLLRQCLKTDPEARPRDMAILVEDLKNIYLQEIGQPYPRSEPQVKTVLADTLNNRAVSMADLGRDQDAIQMFDDALQAESTHTSALYNRNLLLWRTAHLTDTDALEDLLDNQKNLPDDWEVDYLLSLVHLERGDCDATTETIQRAVEKYGTREAFKRVYITAKRLEQKTGRCMKIFPGIENPVNSVAISSQGIFILSGSNDKTVRLWNVYTGECEKTMVGHTNVVKTVAITPDGKFGLSGGWDEDIRLWDLKSGKCLKVLEGHTELVQEVAFTPDGTRAISASSDCTLRLWDLQSGETISTLREHFDSVHAVTVSSDGTVDAC